MEITRLNALLQMDPLKPSANSESAPASGGSDFGTVLKQALESMEADQVKADQMANQLATGKVQDVAQVMIASERASLSLGLAIEVRNKLLEAYQDIMRMPL